MSTVHHPPAEIESEADNTPPEAAEADAPTGERPALRAGNHAAEDDAPTGEIPALRARKYMDVSGTHAPVDDELAASDFDYEQFAALAGPVTHPPWNQPYTVQYRRINHGRREWLTTRLIVVTLLALDFRFIYWLVFQSQYPDLSGWMWRGGIHGVQTDAYLFLLGGMAIGSIVMQLFLLANVVTVSRACMAACDPIPVAPDPRLRVAFITTIVPSKEPIAMAERTLRAATEIVYRGLLDVWLLDEGNSEEVKAMCARLGVRHFSRKGRGHLEFSSGTFANKTKHGNHNRWLWEYAGDYDVVMFVDTDHVPLPIMAERLLGYFRDPGVAFVVGPQFYGNQEDRITRWAESAQYLFHSVIQRGGNRRRCPMLVGTNAAVRTSAIREGYVASITEDMATSLRIHASKSPATGKPWRSVYTPDLVAVGEGPSSWTEFFGQQTRWSAGTFDAILRQVWRVGFKLRPGAMLHYFLMLTYYPSVAIGWIMGIVISACYLGFGISSLRSNASWWLTFYVDIAALQFLLYRFMRRHNVSPHESAGSSGLSGMLVSALTAPIYARSLLKVALGRPLTFNVTAKGSSTSPDSLGTFRYSLMWAVVPIAILAIAVIHQRPYFLMMIWTLVVLGVCLAPIAVWQFDSIRGRRRERRARSSAEQSVRSEQSVKSGLSVTSEQSVQPS